MRSLSVLSLLALALVLVSEVASRTVAKPTIPINCCPKGQFCCGDKCVLLRYQPTTFCPKKAGGCCNRPIPKPVPLPRPIPVPPKPPVNCCGKKQVCCGDGCISKDKAPVALCPPPGKCGCDPKPVPLPRPIPFPPKPPKDCCPKGKFCCGDRCQKDELKPLIDCKDNKTFCCEEPEPEPKDPCEQKPKVVGPCEAAIKSWSFIKESGTCEMFSYGGCKGNDNRFSSKEECDKKCDPTPDDCCKPGFFCCDSACLENGTQTLVPCGKPKCCKPKPPTCEEAGCPKYKWCCKGKCESWWIAKKKGCIRPFSRKKGGKKDEENCCDGGTACCGGNCIPKDELAFTTCAAGIPCC